MSWEETVLENIASYRTDKVESEKISEVYISTENILQDRGGIEKTSYPPKSKKVSGYEVNDILVSNIRPYFKKIWFSDRNGGCSNDILVFKPHINKVFPKYLYYCLSRDVFFDFMMSGANGTKMPRGNKKAIKNFEINLPPLPTQKKIASILSTYDDLIENNLKRIQLLEEAAQRIYKEWFVDFKFPNHENTPINPETGLPDGWEHQMIKEVSTLTMGQSPKSIYYNSDSNGLPFHQGVSNYGFRYVENKIYCTKETRIAEEGDILFSVRAPVGRMNIASEKLIIGRGLCALRSKSESQSFLFYQLKFTFFQEDMIGGGAIFNSVTKKDLETFKLIEPIREVKMKFERIANSIDSQIKSLTIQNQNLKEARDLLLPRLMNRTIEV